MIQCSNCREENPERARFCLNCGEALGVAGAAAEVRKTVTVLFADVVGSTSLGERTDPESTRRMLARYFETIRTVIERHGGRVEKFIGDAVMAVFGIPVLHEDDALRAVRAANEVRASVALLNQELAGGSWSPIALRIGVNTGEVVAGQAAQGHTMVTGDAVNVAARLEQAAEPDEILVGETTFRLVRDAVEVEPMPPLELKGKAEAMAAHRLLDVRQGGGSMRRLDTPLVGRERELKLLNQAFERAIDEQACYLFTLLGTAGVGKSRLVHEFLGQIQDMAKILRARCLPYGEGITFWPIIELVQAAAGIGLDEQPTSAMEKLGRTLDGAPDRDAILARLAATIGLADEPIPTEESVWAVRKFLEWVATSKPLVVVIDDLQWAEPTMLDLMDHVADWSREAPILLLVIARSELLEARPHWAGGKLNATTILLQPLGPEDSADLIANLVDDRELAGIVQQRIEETAEGNPLFVEELIAMLVDQGALRRGDTGWEAVKDLQTIAVPPSISSLVAARLDHLEPVDRDLIGRASVVGKIFQRSAVTELSPPERREEVGPRLMTLVRKELVRPDRSAASGDDAFRFRHLLVRDAAYASLTKEQRADLHARFADWLERIAGDRAAEYEEVIGYHIEQAYRYRSELGLADELTASLGRRASEHLRAAGMRATGRNDYHAAGNLLRRAAALTVDDHERAELLLQVATASVETGAVADADAWYVEAAAAAERDGNRELRLRVELTRLDASAIVDPAVDEDRLLALADRLEEVAKQTGSRAGEVAAHLARANLYLQHCRWMDNLHELERARALTAPLDDPVSWNRIQAQSWNSLRYGPVPASEALRRMMEERPGHRELVPAPRGFAGVLMAMEGRFDDGRAHLRSARDFLRDRGMIMRLGGSSLAGGAIEALAGDFGAAAADLASGIAILDEMGETGVLSTLAAMQSHALYELGRREETEAAIELAKRTGAPTDIATQAEWRQVAAMLAADDGRLDDAKRIIGEALAMVEPTDFLELRGETFEALAHVEGRAGHANEWREALERAVEEYDRKGNLVGAARVRERIDQGPPEAI